MRCCGAAVPVRRRDHRQHRGKSGTFDYSRIDIEPQSPAFLRSLRVLWWAKTSPARNMNSVLSARHLGFAVEVPVVNGRRSTPTEDIPASGYHRSFTRQRWAPERR